MRKIMMAAAGAAALLSVPATAQVQQGLVTVNIGLEDVNIIRDSLNDNSVQIAAPISVNLPIGVAANVCNISVIEIREKNNTCDAENASTALGQAYARQVQGKKSRNN